MFQHRGGVLELRLKEALALFLGLLLSGSLGGLTDSWIGFLIGVGITAWWIVWAEKKYYRQRPLPPLPPNALSRKFAAYYAGPGAGFWSKKKRYTALRQEWLNLLVAYNPVAVTDEQYRAAVGRDKLPQGARPS